MFRNVDLAGEIVNLLLNHRADERRQFGHFIRIPGYAHRPDGAVFVSEGQVNARTEIGLSILRNDMLMSVFFI